MHFPYSGHIRVVMKTTPSSHLLSSLAITAVLALACSATAFDAPQQVDRNSALAAAPRVLEEHPALILRGAAADSNRASSPTASLRVAQTSNPREIELHPEWARSGSAAGSSAIAAGTKPARRSTLRGLAANPRAVEEYPALGRVVESPATPPAYEIAPLK